MPSTRRIMLSIQATPDTKGIRTAKLMDVEHTVIPVVALVEGVLWPANAPSPELALAEEFGRFPDGWNGRPVMLDHPRANGLAVSASSPDVLEASAVGQMFNTVLDGDKLKSEIWINSQRLAALSEDDRKQVQRLIDGDELVEVSTGLFMMLEDKKGKFGDKEYDGVWRNIVPDHLAILPEGITGACSVEDGCGAPRENASGSNAPWKPVMRAAMLSDDAAKDRAQNSPKLKANCACQTTTSSSAPGAAKEDEQGIFQRVLGLFGGILNFASGKNNISDVDVRTAVSTALSTTETDWSYVIAVFQNNSGDGSGNSGTVVYELGFSGKLYERSYSISADTGVVSLGSEVKAVRPVTQFVPMEVVANTATDIGSSLQENSMNKAEIIKALIANEATKFGESDAAWLETLSEEQLAKLEPAKIEPKANAGTASAEAATIVEEPKAAATVEEFIKSAPAEIASVLSEGVRMQASRKQKLIDGLVANSRCRFTKEELGAKSLGELENLAILSNDITFEGASASLEGTMRTQAGAGEGDESNYTAAPDIFSKSAAA